MGILHHPFWLRRVFRHVMCIHFQPFVNYFVWLRITDEGSVPEMRIWSILLIKSDKKWCLHLSRSLFLYIIYKEKKGLLLSPMTKAPTPTEKSKKQRDNTKNAIKTSVTQRLRTDLGRSVGVTIATLLVWFNRFTGSQPTQ